MMMVVIALQLGMFVICWLLDCSAELSVTDRLDVDCAAKYDFTGRRHIDKFFDVWTFINKIGRLPSLQLVRALLKDPVSLILASIQHFIILS